MERVNATYVINLDTDTARLHEFDNMMADSNWGYIRQPAINGKKLINERDSCDPQEIKLLDQYVKRLTWLSCSEIGCLLSHVSLWEKVAKDPNLQRIVIFEDDARTHLDGATIKKLLLDFYNYLDQKDISEPDMLYLGKSLDYCINYEKVWGNIYKSTHPLCLHAYIITKSGAKKLLDMAPYAKAIDMIPIKAIKKKIINVMAFHPSLYFQDIFGLPIGKKVSDLGTNSNLRKLSSALNNTAECIVPQQHITDDTWQYIIVISIAFIATLLLFVLFLSNT